MQKWTSITPNFSGSNAAARLAQETFTSGANRLAGAVSQHGANLAAQDKIRLDKANLDAKVKAQGVRDGNTAKFRQTSAENQSKALKLKADAEKRAKIKEDNIVAQQDAAAKLLAGTSGKESHIETTWDVGATAEQEKRFGKLANDKIQAALDRKFKDATKGKVAISKNERKLLKDEKQLRLNLANTEQGVTSSNTDKQVTKDIGKKLDKIDKIHDRIDRFDKSKSKSKNRISQEDFNNLPADGRLGKTLKAHNTKLNDLPGVTGSLTTKEYENIIAEAEKEAYTTEVDPKLLAKQREEALKGLGPKPEKYINSSSSLLQDGNRIALNLGLGAAKFVAPVGDLFNYITGNTDNAESVSSRIDKKVERLQAPGGFVDAYTRNSTLNPDYEGKLAKYEADKARLLQELPAITGTAIPKSYISREVIAKKAVTIETNIEKALQSPDRNTRIAAATMKAKLVAQTQVARLAMSKLEQQRGIINLKAENREKLEVFKSALESKQTAGQPVTAKEFTKAKAGVSFAEKDGKTDVLEYYQNKALMALYYKQQTK